MISVCDLSLWFGEKAILDGLSFDVQKGETLAIIGESGGGKTSLARVLLGLIEGQYWREDKPRPKGFHWSGEAHIEGVDMLRADKADLKSVRGSKMGLIVQALADALNPHLTILQHMQEMLTIHGMTALAADQALLQYNIPQALHDRYVVGLSGGEIQRVLLALALIPKPDCLILDEPTASLDPGNREAAIASFRQGSQQRAQILITHDLDLARTLSDQVGVLYCGRLVEQGPTEQLFNAPSQNYTRSLLKLGAGERVLSGGSSVPRKQNASAVSCPSRWKETAEDRAGPQEGLHVAGVTHAIGDKILLKAQSLFVPAGSCLALVGPSGCGKSTLARLLTGFETPQTGRITWLLAEEGDLSVSGKDVCQDRPGHQATAALIAQHPHRALARHFTVAECLAEPRRLQSQQGGCWGRRTALSGEEEDVKTLLAHVGLPTENAFLARKASTLSGGEAQRLVIARALAMHPKYLVADEPTSSLDMRARTRILQVLHDLKVHHNLALVLLTHDHDAAHFLADHKKQFIDSRLRPW